MRLEPVSIPALFSSERGHGRVVNGVTRVRSFGVCAFVCRPVSKLLLKGLGKALSLSWVGNSLGVVDLTGL